MKVAEEIKQREAEKAAMAERRYFDTTTGTTYVKQNY